MKTSKGKRRSENKKKLNLAGAKGPGFELELFVSGITLKSIRAIETLKYICEKHLAKRYSLKVIDIYREPNLAKENNVIAVPTLICRRPGPKRMFIGDLSNPACVMEAVGIRKAGK